MIDRPDRRKDDSRFDTLFAEVSELKGRHEALERKLDENTEATKRVEKNTSEIVAAWAALSGGLKVLGWLGIAAKYVSYFAVAVSAIAGAWYAISNWGAKPPRIHP